MITDGRVEVTISSETKGGKTWESTEGFQRHSYSVVGSWNDYACEPMTPKETDTGVVWTYRGKIGANVSDVVRCFYEFFRVCVDEDQEHTWYPEHQIAHLGESIAQGPDNGGKDNFWIMKNPQSGAEFEITFDLNALDRRNIVSWSWMVQPVYDFTGGELNLTVAQGALDDA